MALVDQLMKQWNAELKQDRTQQAMDYYVSQGWTPEQATGIVANLQHESGGMDTEALGDGKSSYGLAQWNGDRRKGLFAYAKQKGEDSPSFQTQLEYVHKELTDSEKNAGVSLFQAKDPYEATRIVSDKFERPGKPMMESRLQRAKELAGKFLGGLGPSEAQASEGPVNVDALMSKWDKEKAASGDKSGLDIDALMEKWDKEKAYDEMPLSEKFAEHPAIKPYLDTAKNVAKLPGAVAGLANATLAAPMGMFKAYNENKDRWGEMSLPEQWGAAFKGAGASAWESVMEPGKWGATSDELNKYFFGKTIEEALPEKFKWAASSLQMIQDTLADPAVWMTAGGKLLWSRAAKSVLGDDLFKNLSKVGKVPELEKVGVPPQLLQDLQKLEQLDEADKRSILRSQAWLNEFRANPPREPMLERGGLKGQPSEASVMRTAEQMPVAEQKSFLEDIANVRKSPEPIQRGAGIEPSVLRDVKPVEIAPPSAAERVNKIVQDAMMQKKSMEAQKAQELQRLESQRIAQEQMRTGNPPEAAQRVMEAIQQARQKRLQQIQGVPEEAALRTEEKVAPSVIQTEQGPKLQKEVDRSLVEQIKADLEARKAQQAARLVDEGIQAPVRPETERVGPTLETAQRQPITKPEPGAPASKLTRNSLINGQTMGELEDKILTKDPGLKEELLSVYERRIAEEGPQEGHDTFQDWVNPAKVGGRIQKEMKAEGVPTKKVKEILQPAMKEYEANYKGALEDAKTIRSNAEQVHGGRIAEEEGAKQSGSYLRGEGEISQGAKSSGENVAEVVSQKPVVEQVVPTTKEIPNVQKEMQGEQRAREVDLLSPLKSEKGAITLEGKVSEAAINKRLKESPEVQAVSGMIGEPEKKSRFSGDGFKTFMKKAIDRFDPLKKDTPQTYDKVRKFSSIKDVAQLDFNKLQSGLEKVRHNFDTFEKYITARRAETRAMMWKESATKPNVGGAIKQSFPGAYENPSKEGKSKWIWQVQNPNEVTLEQAQKAQKDIEDAWESVGYKKADLQKAADFWDDWSKENILGRLRDSGIISNEAYADIVARNDHYATFNIIDHLPPDLSDIPNLKSREYFSVGNQDILKSLKGTTKQTSSPIEATIQKFLQTQFLAERNKAASTFIDELSNHADLAVRGKARPITTSVAEFEKMKEAGLNPFFGDSWSKKEWTKVSRFKDGKVDHWAVDIAYDDILKNLSDVQINKVIQITNGVFRKGVTAAWLPFGVAQVFMDSLAAFTTSPVYRWYDMFGRYQMDLVKGLLQGASFELFGKSKGIDEMLRAGGGLGFYGTLRSPKIAKEQLFKQQLADKTLKELGVHIVQGAKDIPYNLLIKPAETVIGITEFGPRMAVYNRAIKQGKTPAEAAMLARDATVDFSRAGDLTRIANMYIPFLNARVQGKYNLVNAAFLRGNTGDKAQTWAKILAGVVMPTASLYAYNTYHYGELYDQIDGYIKDNYWTFIYGTATDTKTGKTVPKYFTIPKGDVGQAIANPIEMVLDKARGKNPVPMKEWGAQFLADLVLPIQTMTDGQFDFGKTLGSVTPPLAKGAIENFANKNLFTGRDIDPNWMVQENVPEYLRGKSNISQALKDVTKFVHDKTGYSFSPNKIQNLAGNLVGGYGRIGGDFTEIFTEVQKRFVKTSAGANINRASKVYFGIQRDYNEVRYSAIDLAKNGKKDEARQLVREWNKNLKSRISDMRQWGYKDKGGAKQDFYFTPDKYMNILEKGREQANPKPRDWLEERLKMQRGR